ncbi:MAG TPA: GH32 C-terminal domain-containing protein [Cyclobacteriaceae bacterium]
MNTTFSELSNGVGEKLLILYSVNENSFSIDRSASGNLNFSDNFGKIQKGPRVTKSYPTSMQVVVDHSSVEFFADEGLHSMTATMFPTEVFKKVKILSADVRLKSLKIKQLKGIWGDPVTP